MGLSCCAIARLGTEPVAGGVMLHWTTILDGGADGAFLTLMEPSLCPAAAGPVPLCWSEMLFCPCCSWGDSD